MKCAPTSPIPGPTHFRESAVDMAAGAGSSACQTCEACTAYRRSVKERAGDGIEIEESEIHLVTLHKTSRNIAKHFDILPVNFAGLHLFPC
jgi:hypothetical protein